jgi:CHAD domain-containing protein
VGVASPPGIAFGRDQHMLAEGGQQMTTDRTAIRRWLTVGGAPHRPPWRLGKTRHHPIVAPLTAALGASAALGLGLALAKVGSGQLSQRRRRREANGEASPADQASLAEGLRRVALEQSDLALGALEGELDAKAVHEARKAIKRLRTVVRLLEGELGGKRSEREDESLRRAGRGLAGSRDAEVLLATLDALLARHPRRLGRSKGIAAIRGKLARDREKSRRRLLEDPAALAAVTAELSAFRARAAAWPLAQRTGTAGVERGLRRIYRQGRKRRRLAAKAKPKRRTREMHRWRKRVKDLRYAAEMLDAMRPGSPTLPELAKRADKLGEKLGEDHDLAVLAEWVSAEGKRAGARRGARRRLLKRIDQRRRKLRRRALEDGKRLYRRPTKKQLARLRRALS